MTSEIPLRATPPPQPPQNHSPTSPSAKLSNSTSSDHITHRPHHLRHASFDLARSLIKRSEPRTLPPTAAASLIPASSPKQSSLLPWGKDHHEDAKTTAATRAQLLQAAAKEKLLHTPLVGVTEWKSFREFINSKLGDDAHKHLIAAGSGHTDITSTNSTTSTPTSSTTSANESKTLRAAPAGPAYTEEENRQTPLHLMCKHVFWPALESYGHQCLELTSTRDSTAASDLVVLDPDAALVYARRQAWCLIVVQETPTQLERLFGLMCLNNSKYGIVTNYRTSWVVQRAGDHLKLSAPLVIGEEGGQEIMAAACAICSDCIESLCVKEKIRKTLSDDMIPSETWRRHTTLNESLYTGLIRINTTDYIRIKIGTGRRASHNVHLVDGIFQEKEVVVKLTDLKTTSLDVEYRVYKQLGALQGDTIPVLLTHGNFWNMGKVCVFEKCGRRLFKEDITTDLIELMREMTMKLHRLGVLHNNLRLSNFLLYGFDELRIVNFEHALLNPTIAQKRDELTKVDLFYTNRQNEDYWLLYI